MRLLLDECVARKLKRDLIGHEVMTVVEAGYGGMKNGALLRAAAEKFDVLITSIAIFLFSKTWARFKLQY